MRKQIAILILLLTVCLSGYAKGTNGKQVVHQGKASYYSRKATGNKTASGEKLHHDSLTCAHRTYPFGTLLKVTNTKNNKQVIVRVTDRGPHARGRIIDVSYAAAKELGMLLQGVCTVLVEVYHPEKVPLKLENYDLPELDFSIPDESPFTDMPFKSDSDK